MLQALRNEIIVEPVFEQNAGKIVLLPGRNEYNQYHGFVYGVVISVGPKYPYELHSGDKILFRRHEGIRIDYEGKIYLKLKEKWVDSILEKE